MATQTDQPNAAQPNLANPTSHPKNNRHDTIVIGGGLAGLTATAHLARQGRRVVLLERNAQLGGRARTDDLDGWLFNHGGHALYSEGIGRRELRSLDVEPDGAEPTLAGAQLMVAGATTALPTALTSLASCGAVSVADKLRLAAFLARLGRLTPADYRDVTVDDWLRPQTPGVQAIVKALVRLTTYAVATEVMSADAAIDQLKLSQAGVLYLHGGWAALCAQIADAARAAGATIITSASVETIVETSTGVTVSTSTEQYEASSVIMAAGGPDLSARLLGVDASVFGPAGPAPEAAVLDLALASMPTSHRFVLGLDEPNYFSVHSPPARLAPEGNVAAVAMRYLAPGDDASADSHRASLEEIARAAGATDVVTSRFMRRMTVTNGLPIASAGGMKGRPSIQVPGRPRSFLAGDWVGERGLLADGAIASGVDSALLASCHARVT